MQSTLISKCCWLSLSLLLVRFSLSFSLSIRVFPILSSQGSTYTFCIKYYLTNKHLDSVKQFTVHKMFHCLNFKGLGGLGWKDSVSRPYFDMKVLFLKSVFLYLKCYSFIHLFIVSCCALPDFGVSQSYGLTVVAGSTCYISQRIGKSETFN